MPSLTLGFIIVVIVNPEETFLFRVAQLPLFSFRLLSTVPLSSLFTGCPPRNRLFLVIKFSSVLRARYLNDERVAQQLRLGARDLKA